MIDTALPSVLILLIAGDEAHTSAVCFSMGQMACCISLIRRGVRTGAIRKFNIVLYNFLEDGLGRTCSTNGEKKNAYKILVGKPEGKRPLGRPSHRWVDNLKMDLSEIGCFGMDWIDLAQDRDQWRALVNTVLNLRVP
jgi:hypothetical protein